MSPTPRSLSADARRAEAERVSNEIEALCDQLGAGGRLPRHTELMRSLGASERIVMRALEELQRRSRIVRRHGSGTFVTDIAGRSAGTPPASSQDARATASRTIVAIARPDKAIFDRCIELLYDVTSAAGLSIVCHFVGPDQLGNITPEALGHPLGFVVFRRDLADLAAKLQNAGNRVVLVGAPFVNQSFGVPTICGNQDHGGYLAMKHLIDLGHRRIALVDESGDLMFSARWQGSIKAIREADRNGLLVANSVISGATIAKWHQTPETVRDYFSQPDAPTALATWNDRQALELVATLRRAGVRMPHDVSIIGYDNLDESGRAHPALTTVDHFIDQQVAAAVELLSSLEPLDPSRTVIFAPSLVVRESTALVGP
ncbi:MAG TPA: substrate-binding domain-containing protein [Capsulimonadaceae bacterium]